MLSVLSVGRNDDGGRHFERNYFLSEVCLAPFSLMLEVVIQIFQTYRKLHRPKLTGRGGALRAEAEATVLLHPAHFPATNLR